MATLIFKAEHKHTFSSTSSSANKPHIILTPLPFFPFAGPVFQVYKYGKKNAAACPIPEFWSKHIPDSCGFEADVLEKSDPSTGQRYMCSIWDSLAEADLAVQMAEMPPPSGLANNSGARAVPTSTAAATHAANVGDGETPSQGRGPTAAVLSADASGLGSVHAPPDGPAASIFASGGVGGADAAGLATYCIVAATSATEVMPPPRCGRPKRGRSASGVEGGGGSSGLATSSTVVATSATEVMPPPAGLATSIVASGATKVKPPKPQQPIAATGATKAKPPPKPRPPSKKVAFASPLHSEHGQAASPSMVAAANALRCLAPLVDMASTPPKGRIISHTSRFADFV